MTETVYSLKIFQWIERDVVDNIILNCEDRTFWSGEIIMMEWEQSNGEWYIIKSGQVEINIRWQKVAELSAGDIFGEIALLNEEDRTATITTLSEVEVIVLTLDNLIEMINNDENKINKEIMKRIEENLSR
jgi:CRP-like cAMP-binding protein